MDNNQLKNDEFHTEGDAGIEPSFLEAMFSEAEGLPPGPFKESGLKFEKEKLQRKITLRALALLRLAKGKCRDCLSSDRAKKIEERATEFAHLGTELGMPGLSDARRRELERTKAFASAFDAEMPAVEEDLVRHLKDHGVTTIEWNRKTPLAMLVRDYEEVRRIQNDLRGSPKGGNPGAAEPFPPSYPSVY